LFPLFFPLRVVGRPRHVFSFSFPRCFPYRNSFHSSCVSLIFILGNNVLLIGFAQPRHAGWFIHLPPLFGLIFSAGTLSFYCSSALPIFPFLQASLPFPLCSRTTPAAVFPRSGFQLIFMYAHATCLRVGTTSPSASTSSQPWIGCIFPDFPEVYFPSLMRRQETVSDCQLTPLSLVTLVFPSFLSFSFISMFRGLGDKRGTLRWFAAFGFLFLPTPFLDGLSPSPLVGMEGAFACGIGSCSLDAPFPFLLLLDLLFFF